MYIDGTIRAYVDEATSGAPTPGGGSIAAISGALGMSMACMAANFTVGKKKFKAVEPEVRRQLEICLTARDELLRLMDEDTQAYAAVSEAYGMPKDTPEQKSERRGAIQKALVTAMGAPLAVVRVCRDALSAVKVLVDIANPNLISDVGVAAILAEAGLRAAKLNVEINLKFLKDETLADSARREINKAAELGRAYASDVMTKVAENVGGTL